jgi:HEAT repeat protein
MTRTENNLIKTTLLALFVLLFLASALLAEELDDIVGKNKERAIVNLINGIKSPNTGLMKSSVYFAGKYRVKDAVPALLERLNDVEDASTKVLISLALYLIGDKEGIEAIYNLARFDKNEKVRRICRAIYVEYINAAREDRLFVITGSAY